MLIPGTHVVSRNVLAILTAKRVVHVLILSGPVANQKCPAIAQKADSNQIQSVCITLIILLASNDALATVLIFLTIVILNVLILKVKMLLIADTSAKSKKLNAKINVHATNNVHTDVHVHHGASQKNKSVKLSGNMKTTNAVKTVITPEAKCLICAKVDVLVTPHALTLV